MRRAFALAALLVALTLLAACGSSKATPAVSTVDLKPTIELDVHGCPKVANASVTTPCTGALVVTPADDGLGRPVGSVAWNSVMVVKNVASEDRRVVGTSKGDQVFDTGVMHPGDTTTIRLNSSGTIVITATPGQAHTTLVVRPQPTAES